MYVSRKRGGFASPNMPHHDNLEFWVCVVIGTVYWLGSVFPFTEETYRRVVGTAYIVVGTVRPFGHMMGHMMGPWVGRQLIVIAAELRFVGRMLQGW